MAQDIKLKSSGINEVTDKLDKLNEEFIENFKSITNDLKALASDKSVFYSESASANLVRYIEQIEADFISRMAISNTTSKSAITVFINGIEKGDKIG